MRLSRLYIQNHLMLQDLDLRFNREGRLGLCNYALDFLVGLNGSGKSTIFRALVQIFSNLQANRDTEFNYILEYFLGSQESEMLITVSQLRDSENKLTKRMLVTRDGEKKPLYDDSSSDRNFLPRNIIAYTTGLENDWEKLFDNLLNDWDSEIANEEILSNPIDRAIRELPGHLQKRKNQKDSETPPFYLLRYSRLKAITLCGILSNLAEDEQPDSQPLRAVYKSLGLNYFCGFTLRFEIHPKLTNEETFNRLVDLADIHISQGSEHLLKFDFGIEGHSKAKKIIKSFGNSFILFQNLDKLYEPIITGKPTLKQVNLFFERVTEDKDESIEGITKILLFDWLSDGEQSFLGRMALLVMLDIGESLILLDEPEVHFNDFWKREVVNLLNVVMRDQNNHLLITTHSSILLSDVTEKQVKLFVKDQEGKTQIRTPGIKTFAADPSEIMVSTFDIDIPAGRRSIEILQKALDEGNQDELEKLLKIIGPGMWRFRLRGKLEEDDAS